MAARIQELEDGIIEAHEAVAYDPGCEYAGCVLFAKQSLLIEQTQGKTGAGTDAAKIFAVSHPQQAGGRHNAEIIPAEPHGETRFDITAEILEMTRTEAMALRDDQTED
jgi:hypothetical protein